MKQMCKNARLLLIVFLLIGCATAPTFRSDPKLFDEINNLKRIVVLPLTIDVYQVTAGGVKEKMDEWSRQAKQNVMTAIREDLSAKPLLFIKPFEASLLSTEQKANLEETRALFDAVNWSIVFHTYGPPDHRFADKIKNFDYSLGPEIKELAGDADALLFVSGVDHVSTAGRKVLQAGSIILGAFVGIQVTPMLTTTSLSIALVDADTGSILWYNFHSSAGDHDLRNPINTTQLVKDLLKHSPL